MIVVHHLRHVYPDGRCALDDLTFTVSTGETVGLIGPNGAGKTTLFLALAGVLPPPRGAVKICGLDPADPADRRKLPAKLGMVFQDSDDQLFCPTVGEDVAFGPLNLGLTPDESARRTREALEQTGLSGYHDRVPFHLSGGEKRRAAVAGIRAMQPDVWLFDEPSIFLDPRSRRELIALIPTLPGTKLIASHDLRMVRALCDRVIVLDGGRLMADGPRSVMDDRSLMDRHGLWED